MSYPGVKLVPQFTTQAPLVAKSCTGFIHVMENLEKYFFHGKDMEFGRAEKAMEKSMNFVKMSWKIK